MYYYCYVSWKRKIRHREVLRTVMRSTENKVQQAKYSKQSIESKVQ